MRLTDFEIESIKTQAEYYFGKNAKVFLFGSRTDDKKKGGDIDLFIQNNNDQFLNIETKIRFLAKLKTIIGERKIDVVFDNPNTKQKKNFYRSVNRQKIGL